MVTWWANERVGVLHLSADNRIARRDCPAGCKQGDLVAAAGRIAQSPTLPPPEPLERFIVVIQETGWKEASIG